MKTGFICGLLIPALLLTGLPPLTADETDETLSGPKAQAKRMLTLRAAAEKTRGELARLSLPDEAVAEQLTPLLTAQMMQQLEAYRKNMDGRAPAKQWLREQRLQDFRNTLEEITAWAGDQSPLPIETEEVLTLAAPDWKKQQQAGAEAFAAASLNSVYPAARQRAVQTLREQLESNRAYPTAEALNEKLQELDAQRNGELKPLSSDAFKPLDSWLKTLLSDAGTVFEELDREVKQRASTMRKQIAGQYQAQFAVIRDPVLTGRFPENLKSGMQLESFLRRQLTNAIVPRPEARPPAYPVFTVVEDLAADAAAAWEIRRFEKYLDRRDDWQPQAGQTEQRLLAHPEQHTDPEKSARQLTSAYMKDSAGQVAAFYADVDAAYFQRQLEENTPLRKSWEIRSRAVIQQQSAPVRERMMQEQIRRHFALLSGKERLDEQAVYWYSDHGKTKAASFDILCDRLNITRDLRPPMLNETRQEALKRFNAQLEPALEAFQLQSRVLADLEKANLDQLREDVASGVSASKLLKQWNRDWQAGWKAAGQGVSETWQPMFSRVQEQLNKTVRQLYESPEVAEQPARQAGQEQTAQPDITEEPSSVDQLAVELPTEKSAEPAEIPPEESTPDGGGREGEEQVESGMLAELEVYRGLADGVLAFSDVPAGRCRMVFGAPDGRGLTTLEFDPEEVEGSARRIADHLSASLRQVLSGHTEESGGGIFKLFKREGEDPELRMLFQVESPAIRHQMSILVRKHIEAEIQAWARETGSRAPTLLWQDDAKLN